MGVLGKKAVGGYPCGKKLNFNWKKRGWGGSRERTLGFFLTSPSWFDFLICRFDQVGSKVPPPPGERGALRIGLEKMYKIRSRRFDGFEE